MPESLSSVTLEDGRNLEYLVAGADDGPVVVFHHGTPGSALAPPGLIEAASERGLRVVAASRSGYARSSREEGRVVAAAARDTAGLLDALDVDRFATAGWSGGGPHALACAALLQGRCAAAISLAGVAPYLPDEFDWTEGMAQENVDEFQMAIEAGPAYDEMLDGYREYFLALKPEDLGSVRDLFGDLVSDADVNGSTPEHARFIFDNVLAGVREGVGGWRDDDQSFLRPWGFDVKEMRTPVSVWFGDEDLMVPSSHGEWLSANVAGARCERFTAEGHISLAINRFGELLDALLDLVGGKW
jgi:pimeloyl-ACP methyl ester carboxylesterase